jgi:cbb3-type cytochrome oxidase maturation protein
MLEKNRMESLYLLIPIALLIIVFAIKLLFWAINSGQYDDLDTEGHRILFDEPAEKKSRPSESVNPESRKNIVSTDNTETASKQQHEDQL